MKKVLIIDDEEDIVLCIGFRLKAEGFAVLEAYDGLGGLEKAKKEMPDMILLDLMMPKMDGFEVAQKLKEDVGTKSIPFLVISAAVTPIFKKKALSLGALDFIDKPFEMNLLVDQLRHCLTGKSK